MVCKKTPYCMHNRASMEAQLQAMLPMGVPLPSVVAEYEGAAEDIDALVASNTLYTTRGLIWYAKNIQTRFGPAHRSRRPVARNPYRKRRKNQNGAR